MQRLKGKVAIVTGGSQGIGECIVDTFVREGIKAVYSLDVQEGKEKERVDNLVVNVGKFDEVEKAVKEILEKEGHIDILVNNAGITRDGIIYNIDDKAWDDLINVNLKGVFNLGKAVSPIMMDQEKGSIINISSVVGVYGNIGQSNYAAAKAGVIGLTYTWAKEFTRRGGAVRTNAVAPGYVATEMVLTVPEKIMGPLKEKTPLKRLGEPQEIANAVLFLASDESSFVNGHVLEVTGGLRL